MASQRAIRHELEKLAVLYQRHIPDPDIAVMTAIWAEDLQDITDAEIKRALSVYRRQSRYWPLPADIVRITFEARQLRQARASLPEHPSRMPPPGVNMARLVLLALEGNAAAQRFFQPDVGEGEKVRLAAAAVSGPESAS